MVIKRLMGKILPMNEALPTNPAPQADRLLNKFGLPVGITMLPRQGSRPAVIRVTARGKDTTLSLEGIGSPSSVYEHAIDTRIAWLEIPENEVPALREKLVATFAAFCAHYQLTWTPRIVFELNVGHIGSPPPTRRPVRPWTTDDDDLLRARYPHESNADLATALGRAEGAIRMRASKLGVTKS